jgi:hypothetical protein
MEVDRFADQRPKGEVMDDPLSVTRIFVNAGESDSSIYLFERSDGLELDMDSTPLLLTDYAVGELRKALQRYERRRKG